MTSNFGKWLAWLVSSFGIIYKNSVSFWKKGFFADLPKTLTYYHIRTWTAFWSNSRFLVWFVGGKNCPFPLCVISCPYIWYIFNLRSFGPRNNRGIAVWPSLHLHSPFLVNRQKLRFFNENPTFLIKYQISLLVKPIICQNLMSFWQETTEISPFDPLGDSNEKR